MTRWVLAGLLGCEPGEVPLTRPPEPAAPGLDRRLLPVSWQRVAYNRSHVDGGVWLAVGMCGSIGVDVERWPPIDPIDFDVLIRLQLPPRQRDAVLELPAADQPFAALAAWVAYEACTKAAGRAVALSAGDPEGYVVTPFDPGGDRVGCFAVPAEAGAVEVARVDV